MKDLLINKTYRVDYKIGRGAFGLVYAGTDIHTKEAVAMKLVEFPDDPKMLAREADTYRALGNGNGNGNGAGIPRVLWVGTECNFDVLVCNLLGPSLEDLLNYCHRRLSLKTILLVADQAISQIEYIHSKGFLHRDIKPGNFVMGTGKKGNALHTIDFGHARQHSGAKAAQVWESDYVCADREFATLNDHYGRELSWGDDLEALGYVFIYLYRGSLPWQNLPARTAKEQNMMIKEKKTNLSVEKLCEGLPKEFVAYINYARSLPFNEKPDYAHLRQAFRRLFRPRGFKHDNVYDWTVKRYHEVHGQESDPSGSKSPSPEIVCEPAAAR